MGCFSTYHKGGEVKLSDGAGLLLALPFVVAVAGVGLAVSPVVYIAIGISLCCAGVQRQSEMRRLAVENLTNCKVFKTLDKRRAKLEAQIKVSAEDYIKFELKLINRCIKRLRTFYIKKAILAFEIGDIQRVALERYPNEDVNAILNSQVSYIKAHDACTKACRTYNIAADALNKYVAAC